MEIINDILQMEKARLIASAGSDDRHTDTEERIARGSGTAHTPEKHTGRKMKESP